MPGTPCPGQRWLLKGQPPPSGGPKLQSSFGPSTAPPFRAAYGQLCHFTGIQQENKVCKAKVIPESIISFLSCGPAPSAEAPGLQCYPAQKLALYVLIVESRASSTAGISLSRDWRGHPGQPVPHRAAQTLCNQSSFFWGGTGYHAWIPTFKFHLSALSVQVGPEAVGGAVTLLFGSTCALYWEKVRRRARLQGRVIHIYPL